MKSKRYPYINDDTVNQFLDIIQPGMSEGICDTVNGKEMFCVEASWAIARTGEDDLRTDENPCVGSEVSTFRINLNDAPWSSEKARTKGMRELGVAGLGSAHLNQEKFAKAVMARVTKEVLPPALLHSAKEIRNNDPKTAERLTEMATRIEKESLAPPLAEDCNDLGWDLRNEGDGTQYDLGCALNDIQEFLAFASGYKPASMAHAVVAQLKENGASKSSCDKVLRKAADIATDVLISMKSDGSKFLLRMREGKL